MMAAKQDMIGWAMTAGGNSMVPTFGAEPRLGTNPIAFAAPAASEPFFMFDAATTSIAGNKIGLLRRLGRPLEPGWVANDDGSPDMQGGQEPEFSAGSVRMQLPLGSTREMGSHKGYSLGVIVDILCGVMSGAAGFDKADRSRRGHFVAAYNIAGFVPVDEFKKNMENTDINLKLAANQKLPSVDLNARYGLTDRLQLEATVPGVYREDSEILGVGTAGQAEIVTDNLNIGDVEVGAAYQLFTQREWIPGTVLRLRGRFPTGESAFDIDTTTITVNERERTILEETPTGSGFFAVAPGATFIWRSDPVAFFGGGSYTVNLERDQGAFGDIDPGDTAEFFLGMNVALSDRVGLNLSFVDQITGKTVQNGEEQVGSDGNDARISLGGSYGLTPDISILASASVGLTDESPDFVFTVSLPITFSLF